MQPKLGSWQQLFHWLGLYGFRSRWFRKHRVPRQRRSRLFELLEPRYILAVEVIADTFRVPHSIAGVSPSILGNDTFESSPEINVTSGDSSLIVNTDGTVHFPAITQSTFFTYSIAEGGETSPSTATVQLIVNQPPLATNRTIVVERDGRSTIATIASDADQDSLQLVVENGPTLGTVSMDQQGKLTYTPSGATVIGHGFQDSFTYRVSDGWNTSATAIVMVNAVNHAPTATPDTFLVRAGEQLVIDAPGVLVQDYDPDGDNLQAHLESTGLTLTSDGALSYTAGQTEGWHEYAYSVTDGALGSAPASIRILVNHPPVATDDFYRTSPGRLKTVSSISGVLANDTDDTVGNPLVAGIVDQPEHGQISFAANGSFTYLAEAEFTGTIQFSYRAFDGYHEGAITWVTIEIANAAPVAGDDNAGITSFESPLSISIASLLNNDTDSDGDDLTLLDPGGAHHGDVSLDALGMVVFVPEAGYSGPASFGYTVSDGQGGTAVGNVTLVVGSNQSPKVLADQATVVHGQSVSIDVLANDLDPEGRALTIAAGALDATIGTLTVTESQRLHFTAATSYVGTAMLNYVAADGRGGSSEGTVVVTITNQSPRTAEVYKRIVSGESWSSTGAGLLASVSDDDQDGLTFALSVGPTHGIATINTDGSWGYQPFAGYWGSDNFQFSVSDGPTSTIGTIQIFVNDAPVLSEETAASLVLGEDTRDDNNLGIQVLDLLDSTASGVSIVSDTNAGSPRGIAIEATVDAAFGTWQYSRDGGQRWADFGIVSDGVEGALLLPADDFTRIRFVPAQDVFGQVSSALSFRAWDQSEGRPWQRVYGSVTSAGGHRALSIQTSTLDLEILGNNDSPAVRVPDTQQIQTNQVLTFSHSNSNSISVTDVDAGIADVRVSIAVSHGTLTLASTSGLTITGNQSSTLVLIGSLINVGSALDGLTFISPADFRGVVALTVEADDLGHQGSGGPLSDLKSVQIHVGVPFGFDGSELFVTGTPEADTIAVDFDTMDTFRVSVNGVVRQYSNEAVQRITINALDGRDVIVVTSPNRTNSVTFSPFTLEMFTDDTQLRVASGEQFFVYGHAGDEATFQDSAGDDLFFGLASVGTQPTMAMLQNSHWFAEAIGFSRTIVTSSGGSDDAVFVDSPGNDLYEAAPAHSRLSGVGYEFVAQGFARTYAHSQHGGVDVTRFTDSAGNDFYYGVAGYAILTGSEFMTEAIGFGDIVATASSGSDQAAFWDTDQNDLFVGRAGQSRLTRTGVSQTANGFDSVTVLSYRGGSDTASLYGGNNDDFFVGSGSYSRLQSDGSEISVWGVSDVAAYGQGGVNTAALFGVLGHYFTADGDLQRLTGPGFSVEIHGFTVSDPTSVIGINHKPTLIAQTEATFHFTAEMQSAVTNEGLRVNQILVDSGGIFGDIDQGALPGVAVIGTVDSTDQGTWQARLNATSSWFDLMDTSPTQARLLAGDGDARIRFVPSASFPASATPGIVIRAWDRTAGENGSLNSQVEGIMSALSIDYTTVRLSMNFAPTISGFGPLDMSTIDEDADTNLGNTISEVLGERFADADGTTLRGLAIVGAPSASGTWQFSQTAGAAWDDVGSVSATSALLLADEPHTRLRFVPSANYQGTAALTVRAWDRSTGIAGTRQVLEFGASRLPVGGVTAFGEGTTSLRIEVSALNDAPEVIEGQVSRLPGLSTSLRGASANVGTSTTELVSQLTRSDADKGALSGIAIMHVDRSHGVWEYSVNGGTTWVDMNSPTANNALLLATSTINRIRFLPHESYYGDVSQGMQFRLWDRTQGINGDFGNATFGGGTLPYSANTATAAILVNDAPSLSTSAVTVDFTPQTSASNEETNQGERVIDLVGSRFHDVNPNGVPGIGIVHMAGPNGRWQFSIDAGGTWQDIDGQIAEGSALLLSAAPASRIRFLLDSQFSTSDRATIVWVAWDGSLGRAGEYLPTIRRGGSSALSDGFLTSTLWMNDSPVLENVPTSLDSTTQSPTSANTGTLISKLLFSSSITLSDVNGDPAGIAVTSVDSAHGKWSFTVDGGTHWSPLQGVSADGARLLADTPSTRIRFVPDLGYTGEASLRYRGWDQTQGNAGGLGNPELFSGPDSPFSATEATATVVVTVNHAPTLVNALPLEMPSLREDEPDNGQLASVLLAEAGFADVDEGAVQGMAITFAGREHGRWQFRQENELWRDIPSTVSETMAWLLPIDGATRLRYRPTDGDVDVQDYVGSSDLLTFRAWDRTASEFEGYLNLASTFTANGSVSEASRSVRLNITAVNDPPTIIVPSVVEVAEDTGAVEIDGFAVISAGPANESDQEMAVTVTAAVPQLFEEQPSIDVTGKLTFKAHANAFGQTNVTITVTDSGGFDAGGNPAETTKAFVINLGAVNDAPIIDAVAAVELESNIQASQVILLSGISPGMEESQNLVITAESDDPSLVQIEGVAYASPSSAGELRIKPVANATGTTLIRITLRDSGGTNHADDRDSTVMSFNVTVRGPQILINGATTPLTYEEGAVVAIQPSLVLSSSSVSTLSGATISLEGFQVDEDLWRFDSAALPAGVSGSVNTTTGALVFSGTAEIAAYQLLLRSVEYVNSSEKPHTNQRALHIEVSIGTAGVATLTRPLYIEATTDAPVVVIDDVTTTPTGQAIATGIVTTPAGITVASAVIAWGDGTSDSVTLSLNGAFTATHQYSVPNDGFEIVLTATSDDTGSGSNIATTRHIVAFDYPPTLNVSTDTLVFVEDGAAIALFSDILLGNPQRDLLTGASVSLAGCTFFDDSIAFAALPPSLNIAVHQHFYEDAIVYNISGEASVETYAALLRSATFHNGSQVPVLNVRTVEVSIRDGNRSATASRSLEIQANDDPPSIHISSIVANAIGHTIVQGSVSTPDGTELSSVTIDWGNGLSQVVALSEDETFHASHTYSNTILAPTLVLTASGDGTASIHQQVEFDLCPTSPTLEWSDSIVSEGEPVILSGEYGDAPEYGNFSVTVNWGDGTFSTISSEIAFSFSATHTYVQPGEYFVTTTVTDPSGHTSEAAESSLLVHNSVPELGPLGLSRTTLNEMGSTTLTGAFTALNDEPATLYVKWGDSSLSEAVVPIYNLALGRWEFSVDHQYKNDPSGENNTFTITAYVVDEEDVSSDPRTMEVTVNNVAPTITIDEILPDVLIAGNEVTLNGSVLELSTLDPAGSGEVNPLLIGGTIDWGDSSAIEPISARGEFSLTHRFLNAGIFTINVSFDDGGDHGLRTWSRELQIVAPSARPVLDDVDTFLMGEQLEDVATGEITPYAISSLAEQLKVSAGSSSVPGFAVIGVTNNHGQWQYSLDGEEWLNLTNLSNTHGLLLASRPNTGLRYLPTSNYFGPSDALTVVGWNSIDGSPGGYANVAARDADLNSPFSQVAAAVYLQSTVIGVNDAPTFSVTSMTGIHVPRNSFESFLISAPFTITAGPPNEVEPVHISYIATDPSHFYHGPAMYGTTLSFSPQVGAPLELPVTVTIIDWGGTSYGGKNTTVGAFTIYRDAPDVDLSQVPTFVLDSTGEVAIPIRAGWPSADPHDTLEFDVTSRYLGVEPRIEYDFVRNEGLLYINTTPGVLGSSELTVTVRQIPHDLSKPVLEWTRTRFVHVVQESVGSTFPETPLSFTEGQGPTAIAPHVTLWSTRSIASLEVHLNTYASEFDTGWSSTVDAWVNDIPEQLSYAGTLPTTLQATVSQDGLTITFLPAAGMLPTASDYQAALRLVRYQHFSESPDTTVGRSIIMTALLDDDTTILQSRSLTVRSVDSPPTIQFRNPALLRFIRPGTTEVQHLWDVSPGRGESQSFTFDTTDPDISVGSPTAVEPYLTDGVSQFRSYALPFSVAAHAAPGLHEFELTITDAAGEQRSRPVSVWVNTPPTLQLHASPTLPVGVQGLTDVESIRTTTVAELLNSLGPNAILVPDSGSTAQGIAISEVNRDLGTLEYRIGNDEWKSVEWLDAKQNNSLAPNSANGSFLILAATTELRFVPRQGYHGSNLSAFQFALWDGTAFSNGQRVSPVDVGGQLPLSDARATVLLTIAASSPPTWSSNAALHAGTFYADIPTSSQSISTASLIGGAIADADSGAFQGLQITAVDFSLGEWEFTVDGVDWQAIRSQVELDLAPLFLPKSEQARLRLNANTTKSGPHGSALTVRAWDQTIGLNGWYGSIGAQAKQQYLIDNELATWDISGSVSAETRSIAVTIVSGDLQIQSLGVTNATPLANQPLQLRGTVQVASGSSILPESGDLFRIIVDWNDVDDINSPPVVLNQAASISLNLGQLPALTHTYTSRQEIRPLVTVDWLRGTEVLRTTSVDFSLFVRSAPPELQQLALQFPSSTRFEGDTAHLVGEIIDTDIPAQMRTWTVDVVWGDGQSTRYRVTNPDGHFDIAHEFADESTQVTVQVTDADGVSSVMTSLTGTNVAVGNVAPALLDTRLSAFSGLNQLQVIGVAIDPGNDPLVVSAMWPIADGSISITSTPLMPGEAFTLQQPINSMLDQERKIEVVVVEADLVTSKSPVKQLGFPKRPYAPTISVSHLPLEGSVVLSGTTIDPNGDANTIVINWGDGSLPQSASLDENGRYSVHRVFTSRQALTVSAYAIDTFGLESDPTTLSVVPLEVMPELGAVAVEYDPMDPLATNINEGGSLALRGHVFLDHADIDEGFSVQVDWLDGSTPADVALTSNDEGGWTFDLIHTYADDVSQVRFILSDNDGNWRTRDVAVAVNNIAPLISATHSYDEATDSLSLVIAVAVDPGVNDQLTYSINWGDSPNTSPTLVTPGTAVHTYSRQASAVTYTGELAVSDEDGGVNTYSFTVSVPEESGGGGGGNPQAPEISLSGPENVNEGTSLAVSGTYSGTDATAAWNDGTSIATSIFSRSLTVGNDQEDALSISASVTNSAGTDSDTHSYRIINVPPELSISQASVDVDEGEYFTIDFTASDVFDEDIVVYYQWDGQDERTLVSGTSITLGGTDDDPSGTSADTMTLRIIADDGTDTTEKTVDITVSNVAPTLSARSNLKFRRDHSINYSDLVESSDPCDEVTFSGTPSLPRTFGIGFHTIEVTASDDDLGSSNKVSVTFEIVGFLHKISGPNYEPTGDKRVDIDNSGGGGFFTADRTSGEHHEPSRGIYAGGLLDIYRHERATEMLTYYDYTFVNTGITEPPEGYGIGKENGVSEPLEEPICRWVQDTDPEDDEEDPDWEVVDMSEHLESVTPGPDGSFDAVLKEEFIGDEDFGGRTTFTIRIEDPDDDDMTCDHSGEEPAESGEGEGESEPHYIEAQTTIDWTNTIDVKINDIPEAVENQLGALVLLNDDYSKEQVDDENDTYLRDNEQLDGEWHFDPNHADDYSSVSITLNQYEMSDGTMRLYFDSDLLVWDIGEWDGNGVPPRLESGDSIDTSSNSVQLILEGIERSTSLKESVLRAEFTVSETGKSVSDKAYYSVVSVAVATDGDRNGKIEFDKYADRQLQFWYDEDRDTYGPYDSLSGQPGLLGDYYESLDENSLPSWAGDDFGSDFNSRQLQDYAPLYVGVDSLIKEWTEQAISLPVPFLSNTSPDNRRFFDGSKSRLQADLQSIDGQSLPYIELRGFPAANLDTPLDYLTDREQADSAKPVIAGIRQPNGRSATLLDGLFQRDSGSGSTTSFTSSLTTADDYFVAPFLFHVKKPTGFGDSARTVELEVSLDARLKPRNLPINYQIDVLRGVRKVRLELSSIRNFYDHYRVPSSQNGVDLRKLVDGSDLPAAVLLHSTDLTDRFGVGKVFDSSLDYTVFVHGWNTAPWDRVLAAESFTKFMYWQGYRGAIGLFDWPTLWDSESLTNYHPEAKYALNQTYTPSEYVALRSANSLKSLLNQKGPNTTLVAHSMGNVVALEALRNHRLTSSAQLVKSYIAMQAAVPASALGVSSVVNDSIDPRAYGLGLGLSANAQIWLGQVVSKADRSKYPDLWSNRYVTATQAAGESFNYYNSTDVALNVAWWANNSIKWTTGNPADESFFQNAISVGQGMDMFNRPTDVWKYDYRYGNDGTPKRFEWELVAAGIEPQLPEYREVHIANPSNYETLAFLSQSRTKPIGTMFVLDSFSRNRNMAKDGLPGGNQHEANHSYEFMHDMATTWEYWSHLLIDAGVSRHPRNDYE